MRDMLWICGITALVGAVSGALIYGICIVQCSDVGDQSGKETKFSVLSGCYVKVNGEWMPAGRWRAVDQ